MMKKTSKAAAVFLAIATFAVAGQAAASSVSEREYKRGYADCKRGTYDQNQHGASYKRGCRAAENSRETTGHTISKQADKASMGLVCRGAVIGRFHHSVRHVRIENIEHGDYGWGIVGIAALDDGSTSDFVCNFSSDGHFKRINASDPVGASYEMDHEEYCPADVTEADRYKYPGCSQG